MLSVAEKCELKSTAAYIKQLPGLLQQWSEVREKLVPRLASSIEGSWPLLGLSLDAFFSDLPNPLPALNLGEEVERMIQTETAKYLSLSILLFQSEHFLRGEAITQGINIENLRRSDFVKIWAIEGCICEIVLYLQTHWEGYSASQWKERKRESLRYASGEIEETAWEQMLKRWQQEDSKLALGDPPPESCMPFSKFCIDVFKKYHDRLPEFAHFTRLWLDEDFPLKAFIINGEPRESQRRRRRKNP
jgi:hypothetical protein